MIDFKNITTLNGEEFVKVNASIGTLSESYEGEVRITPQTINGFGDKFLEQAEGFTLLDFIGETILVGLSFTHWKVALFLGVLEVAGEFPDENEYVHYTNILERTLNAYHLTERIVEVYSNTPTGYEWVPYIITQSRQADLDVLIQWYPQGSPDSDAEVEVYNCVQIEYAYRYGDDLFLTEWARSKYLSSDLDVEILKYNTGERWEFPENLPED